jgi:hypothetical protein
VAQRLGRDRVRPDQGACRVSVIITPDTVTTAVLDDFVSVDFSMRLFTDPLAGLDPAELAELTNADFTEATFPGYAAVTLTSASWTVTAGAGSPSFATYPQQTFERSSSGTAQLVYGYWVRQTSDSVLRWFEAFDGPLSFELIGARYRVTPRYEA